MPKLDINKEEAHTLVTCIDSEIKSVKRSQAAAKTPEITEIYRQHQAKLVALQNKIIAAPDK